MMKFKNTKGSIISDLNSWEKAFIEVDHAKRPEQHWKRGRSAYELAYCFCENNGFEILNDLLDSIGIHENNLSELGTIEMRTNFDKFRNGRAHDLAISGKHCFIGIEAKVDEPFGKEISDELADKEKDLAKNPASKGTVRIHELTLKYLGVDASDPSIGTLSYQLLTALAGCLTEAEKSGVVTILPIMVFHSTGYCDAYNPEKGNTNREKFIQFMDALSMTKEENRAIAHTLSVLQYHGKINGQNVYAFYIDIAGTHGDN